MCSPTIAKPGKLRTTIPAINIPKSGGSRINDTIRLKNYDQFEIGLEIVEDQNSLKKCLKRKPENDSR